MNLAEEYHQRHALRGPVIHRPTGNYQSFLYEADPKIWGSYLVLLKIASKQEANHPSYYELSWFKAVHNGASSGRGNLTLIDHPSRVEWDSYDAEILKAAQRDDGLIPITDKTILENNVWKLFLYTNDDVCASLPMLVRHELIKSVDDDFEIQLRQKHFDNVCQYLRDSKSSLLGKWNKLQQYYDPTQYAFWFGSIATSMRDQDYKRDFGNLQGVA